LEEEGVPNWKDQLGTIKGEGNNEERYAGGEKKNDIILEKRRNP